MRLMAIDAMRTDRDRANDLLDGILNEGKVHSNLYAWLLALANENRGVQLRVLGALRTKKRGRPRNAITDEMWLEGVESWRSYMMRKYPGRDFTYLEIIEDWLKNTDTRYNRQPDELFKPNRASGRAEIKRMRDAIVRAKRSRKNWPK